MSHSISRRSIIVALAAGTVLFLQAVVLPHRALAGPPPSLPEPTQLETGVPVYPGAKYDGVTSAGYSENETFYWFYLTADPIEKVVAFYQQKIPSPPLKIEQSFLFTIEKGDSVYFPNRGVLVETNKLFPKPTKTVISITKPKP